MLSFLTKFARAKYYVNTPLEGQVIRHVRFENATYIPSVLKR